MTTQNTPKTGPGTAASQEAKQKAADLADQTKAAAADVAQDMKSAAAAQADAAKATVADEVSGVASALRTAASELRSGSPQERTFGQIAEALADASDGMREKDLGAMVEDVSNFARKNPLVFLGGAALLGFAATRFAKASDKPRGNSTMAGTTADTGPTTAPSAPAAPYTTTPGSYS